MNLPTLLSKAKELGEKADRHVCDLASGKARWNMSIPPQDDDSDILLSNAIRLLPLLVRIVERQKEALGQVLFEVGHVPQCSKKDESYCDAGCSALRVARTALAECEKIAGEMR